ncbi:Conserved oligomeric golgi complex subunit, partial [Thalictrum thalictroides]
INNFSDQYEDFEKVSTDILGVSVDNVDKNLSGGHKEWTGYILKCSKLFQAKKATDHFKQLLSAGMEQLAATVTPRIRSMLDTLETTSYELSEVEYSENEVHNPWVQKLLHAVETNIIWLQPAMTVNNYDSLFTLSY